MIEAPQPAPGTGMAFPPTISPPKPTPAPPLPAVPSTPRPGFVFATQADTSTGQFQLTLAFPTREGMLHFIETLLKPRAKELGIDIQVSVYEASRSGSAQAL